MLQSIGLSLSCSMPKRDRPHMKDDLTVRYEEILRLREELERLLARSKQPPSICAGQIHG
jgi:hypothetical protein